MTGQQTRSPEEVADAADKVGAVLLGLTQLGIRLMAIAGCIGLGALCLFMIYGVVIIGFKSAYGIELPNPFVFLNGLI